MKRLFFILPLIIIQVNAFGQKQATHREPKDTIKRPTAFAKGENYLSLGIGTGNIWIGEIQNNFKETHVTGPFFAKGEIGVTNHVGVGINLSYLAVSATDSVIEHIDTTVGVIYYKRARVKVLESYGILFRTNFHIGHSQKVDPYFGIGIGYRGGKWYRDINDLIGVGPVFPIGFAFSFGTRVYFNENIGAYAELGVEKAFLQVGVTFKVQPPK